MPLFSWPTDPPGKKAAHTITWQQHQANLQGQPSNLGRGNLALGGAAQFSPAVRAAATGGTGAATPSSPATDPGAGGTPAPLDMTYQNQLGLNEATEATTIAGLRGSRARNLQSYGYSGEFGEDDALIGGSLKFDPTDPYSRAALMQKLYDGQHKGTGLQRASAGGLYQGSYQTAQDVVTSQNLQAEDQLQKSLMEYLEGVGGQIGGARTQRGQADIDAAVAAGARAQGAPY